ncbi:hypothetical protein N7470_004298 [Penicillium chermesinum]|nr:hypothetical protein N7470_004298 [Penicillium chermesinum]
MPPDAATLPSPPNKPPWKDSRPYSVGGNMESTSAAFALSSLQNGSFPQRPRYPHIKDLQDQATLLSVQNSASVSRYNHPWGTCGRAYTKQNAQLDELLRTASDALEQSKLLVDSDMSDKAYVQYLCASEITVNTIPHHPDYETYANQPVWYNDFKMLMRAVSSKQGTMNMVKLDIMEDNRKSNIQPTSSSASTSPTSQVSSPPRSGRENREPGKNSMRMPSPTQFQCISNPQPTSNRIQNSTEDVLAQRFAKLKASPPLENGGGSRTYIPSAPALQASTTYTSNTPMHSYSSP